MERYSIGVVGFSGPCAGLCHNRSRGWKGSFMKGIWRALLCVVAVGFVQPVIAAVVTLDENGNGMGPTGPIPFVMAPDPTPGGGGAVLTYILPFPVASGDVQLVNLSEFPNQQSDFVRYMASDASVGGAPAVLFYSDNGDTDLTHDLADVGLPQTLPGPAVGVTETGSEGMNSAVYTPPFPSHPVFTAPAPFAPITYDL